MLRLKKFPRGLGKGYDAALLGAWLDELMGAITTGIPDARYGFYLWHKYCLIIDFARVSGPNQKCGKIVGNTLGILKDCYKEIFAVMKWGMQSTNIFFPIICGGRLWLTTAEGEELVLHGWNLLASVLQTSW